MVAKHIIGGQRISRKDWWKGLVERIGGKHFEQRIGFNKLWKNILGLD